MKLLVAILSVVSVLVLPAAVAAHPHIWISQLVRVVTKDGKFTHVEIEWRFDPFSSEIEIPLIDENGDGRFSANEVKLLANDMMPELQKYGFMTWLNTGAKDFRPPKRPVFSARVDDPASFKPADWDRSAGDGGQPMPSNKRVEQPVPQKRGPRNLVYVMRFELPQPVTHFSIATFDPDDFIRIELDRTALPAGCTAAKHPSYKAEFIRGYPVFADLVTCQTL
ncbi:MAG: DUF1007 family protein [Enhydrobacter sp.]|nr:MAG: DUF1007 family protein [Enhydrobacter sp.]